MLQNGRKNKPFSLYFFKRLAGWEKSCILAAKFNYLVFSIFYSFLLI